MERRDWISSHPPIFCSFFLRYFFIPNNLCYAFVDIIFLSVLGGLVLASYLWVGWSVGFDELLF
jgi:hypothetical protein